MTCQTCFDEVGVEVVGQPLGDRRGFLTTSLEAMDSQKGKRGLGWVFRILIEDSRGAAFNNQRLLRLVIPQPAAEVLDGQVLGHARRWGLVGKFGAF